MSKESATHALPTGFKLRSKDRVYEIVKVLGAGSFGITYLATAKVAIGNITTTVRFAVKEHFMSASCYRGDDGATVLSVPAAESDVAQSRADFITEANRLKKLCMKSRSIVSVNETFEANGTAYYVMEYLDGGSLSKCPERDAVSTVMQIAYALDEIHKEHVLHLDLKPDNVVLKTNDRNETYPVLIDFGISKHFDSKGRPTSSLAAKGASPGYAPQEQYAGVSEFSPKYDIYALGAVLFYLCTGKNPPDAFKISPNQQELRKELTGKVSSGIERTILNAMKPSAMERTPGIRQFCDDLTGFDFVPVLNVSSSSLEFSDDRCRRSVSVDSNIAWSVHTDCDWCRAERESDSIVIAVSGNKETGSRTCDVVVDGAPYQVSQLIHVKQAGTGTVVLHRETTWRERRRRRAYIALGVVSAGCIIAGSGMLFKPDHEKESRLLTEAIDTRDGQVLGKYADLDSARAFLPYAQFLHDHGDREEAVQYANRALELGGATATQAEELLTVINAEINHIQKKITVNQGVITETSSGSAQEATHKTETNDEKFARASKDFDLMLSLAQDNYAKAFYPLAEMYFRRNSLKSSRFWANKAINANVFKSDAEALLGKINAAAQESSNSGSMAQSSQNATNENQDNAKRLQDALKDPVKGATTLTVLAEIEHYAPAYYHYARMLLQNGRTAQAKEYLRKSIEKGSNVSQSRQLLEAFEE